MIEIYTPKEWTRLFGGEARLVIDDEGYIYSAEEYKKFLGGTPMGWVDYENRNIYGKDYASLMKSPIGFMIEDGGVAKVYEAGKSPIFNDPLLYIRDGKLYSAEDYARFFDTPSGYIKKEEPVKKEPKSAPKIPVSSGGGGDGCIVTEMLVVLGVAIAIAAISGIVEAITNYFGIITTMVIMVLSALNKYSAKAYNRLVAGTSPEKRQRIRQVAMKNAGVISILPGIVWVVNLVVCAAGNSHMLPICLIFAAASMVCNYFIIYRLQSFNFLSGKTKLPETAAAASAVVRKNTEVPRPAEKKPEASRAKPKPDVKVSVPAAEMPAKAEAPKAKPEVKINLPMAAETPAKAETPKPKAEVKINVSKGTPSWEETSPAVKAKPPRGTLKFNVPERKSVGSPYMKAPATLDLSGGVKIGSVRGTVTESREIRPGKTVYCAYCGNPCRINIGKGISYVTCGNPACGRKFRVNH